MDVLSVARKFPRESFRDTYNCSLKFQPKNCASCKQTVNFRKTQLELFLAGAEETETEDLQEDNLAELQKDVPMQDD